MSKKQIGILVGTGVFVIIITIGVFYFISNKELKSKNNKEEITDITVGDYNLKLGKYKGIVEEYDYDNDKMNQNTVYLELTDTMIKTDGRSDTYTIKGNKLVTSSNLQYEVIANNKIVLLAGGGVEYSYES